MSTEPMRRTRRGPQESSAARRSRSAGEAPWSSAPAPAAVQAPPAPLAWGSPAEYLRMAMGRSPIVFLLGDGASMISGVSLPIDGGYTSR